MAAKYRETDYLYGSARIRALEPRLLSRDKLEHMLESGDAEAILATLPEFGFTLAESSEGGAGMRRENSLLSVLEDGFAELAQIPGGAEFSAFLRIPYDCNNMKALIKCAAREVSPDSMLFETLGRVSATDARLAFEQKRYDAFSPRLAAAIPEAEAAFARTGNPQLVDLILDRACFADMLALAGETEVPYCVELVRMKIDLTNLLTCVRLIRMHLGASASALLADALLEGGSLEPSLWQAGLEQGEAALRERIATTAYGALCDGWEDGTPLYLLEKRADDLRMDESSSCFDNKISLNPCITVTGVLSSCDAFAKKSLFCFATAFSAVTSVIIIMQSTVCLK